MLRKELSAIKRNKFFWVVIIALALVPAVYNFIFLGSMWNPYGNLSKLPVAVVNLDKEYNSHNLSFRMGDDVIKDLKKTKDLDYHFTGLNVANEELKKGKYYMVITFPSDFSKNTASLTEHDPKIAEIDYKTTKGHNYISSKMSEGAMAELKSKISENITKTYTKRIFAKLGDMKKGIGKTASGSNKISNGTVSALNGSEQLSYNLKKLASSSLIFNDGVNKLDVGLSQYVDGVSQADTGGQQLVIGVNKLADGTQQLADGTSKVANGANDFKSKMNQYIDGVSQADTGGQKLANGANKFANGTQQLADGTSKVANGANDFKFKMKQYIDGVSQADTGGQKLANGVNKLSNNIPQLADGLNELSKNSVILVNAVTSLDNKTKLSDAIFQQISQIDQGLKGMQEQISSAASRHPDDANLIKTAEQYTSLELNTETMINQLEGGINNTHGSLDELLKRISAYTSEVNNASKNVNASLPKLQELQEGASTLMTGLDLLNLDKSKITKGTNELANGANELDSKTHQLTGKTQELQKGASTLMTGLDSLNLNGSKITKGTNELANGANKVDSGTHQLTSKTKELQNGTSTLMTGLDILNLNGSKITKGTKKLTNGETQVVLGTQRLAAGGSLLTNGLVNLNTGTSTLSKALNNADTQLSRTNFHNKNAKEIASPIKINHTDEDNSPVNGFGMTPYMICVALFIGALASNVVIGSGFSKSKRTSGREFMISKVVIHGVIALAQAVIVYGAVYALGLRANYGWRMLVSIILISFTFMAINTFFLTWLGKVGEFIMIVVLVLQLSTSAGTYPLQLSPKIYQIISPWLPMTYSIKMLRETIGLQGHIGVYIILFILLLFIFTSLLSVCKRIPKFA